MVRRRLWGDLFRCSAHKAGHSLMRIIIPRQSPLHSRASATRLGSLLTMPSVAFGQPILLQELTESERLQSLTQPAFLWRALQTHKPGEYLLAISLLGCR